MIEYYVWFYNSCFIVKKGDFIEIDANKSEKEIYEELVAKGYKFTNPVHGKYIGKDASEEYNDTDKANENPAIITLFNDFQKSNPEVKGVKVSNHIIGNEKIKPFYVIYDNKSFYGEGTAKTKPTEPIQSKVVGEVGNSVGGGKSALSTEPAKEVKQPEQKAEAKPISDRKKQKFSK